MSAQFSSLERNVQQVHSKEEDAENVKKNVLFVFVVSFLTVFILMLSICLVMIRIVQCIKKLKREEARTGDKDNVIYVESGGWLRGRVEEYQSGGRGGGGQHV